MVEADRGLKANLESELIVRPGNRLGKFQTGELNIRCDNVFIGWYILYGILIPFVIPVCILEIVNGLGGPIPLRHGDRSVIRAEGRLLVKFDVCDPRLIIYCRI